MNLVSPVMRTINFSQTNNDLRESDSEENKKLIVPRP